MRGWRTSGSLLSRATGQQVRPLGGVIAWKEVSLVPAPFANPSHLPFPSGLALGGTSVFDPFAKPPGSTETKEGLEGAQALPSGKPSSPVGKQEAGG